MSWRVWSWALLWAVHRSRRSPHLVSSSVRAFSCTTALFYLMPVGHAEILHSGKLWLGLFFVLFPLGFLLYGVNDIVDAETDSLNPREGTFMLVRAERAHSSQH